MATDEIVRGRQCRNASFARHSENRSESGVVSGLAARVTTPLTLASDTGGFEAMAGPAPGVRLSQGLHQSSRASLRNGPVCPQGPTGTAPCAVPPLASRVCGSLGRGGQGRWTLGTAGHKRIDGGRRHCANYYSVIIRSSISGIACSTYPLLNASRSTNAAAARQMAALAWGYLRPSRALASASERSRPASRSASPVTTARMNARSSSAVS